MSDGNLNLKTPLLFLLNIQTIQSFEELRVLYAFSSKALVSSKALLMGSTAIQFGGICLELI